METLDQAVSRLESVTDRLVQSVNANRQEAGKFAVVAAELEAVKHDRATLSVAANEVQSRLEVIIARLQSALDC